MDAATQFEIDERAIGFHDTNFGEQFYDRCRIFQPNIDRRKAFLMGALQYKITFCPCDMCRTLIGYYRFYMSSHESIIYNRWRLRRFLHEYHCTLANEDFVNQYIGCTAMKFARDYCGFDYLSSKPVSVMSITPEGVEHWLEAPARLRWLMNEQERHDVDRALKCPCPAPLLIGLYEPAPALEDNTEVDTEEDTEVGTEVDDSIESEAMEEDEDSSVENLELPEAPMAFQFLTWRAARVQRHYEANVSMFADPEKAQQSAYALMAWHNCQCQKCVSQRARGWLVYPLEDVMTTWARFHATRTHVDELAGDADRGCLGALWERRFVEVKMAKGNVW